LSSVGRYWNYSTGVQSDFAYFRGYQKTQNLT
jgi:hypothetical protein